MSQAGMQPNIHVTLIGGAEYQVTVTAKTITEHQVSVSSAYAQKLTQGQIDIETLLLKSFEFLLAREPNTSILRKFDLSVIANYFVEYEEAIKKVL